MDALPLFTPSLEVDIFDWSIVIILFLIDLAVRIWLIIYIPKDRKPTAATAWLLLIALLPFFGAALFFIIGNTKLSKKRRNEQVRINQHLAKYTENIRSQGLTATIPAPFDTSAKLSEALTKLAPTSGNAVEVLTGYDELIEGITAAVNRAEHYVYVEFYILALDAATEPFFKALEKAVQRGVAVHVLFDAYGSYKLPRRKEMAARLTAMGAEWHKILPFSLNYKKYNRPDLRNHRKIVVVDNTDAFIGSLNMIEKTYNRKDSISYIELAAHLQGPSVNEAAAVFASDWYSETGVLLDEFMLNSAPSKKGSAAVQLVPSGPAYPHENNLKLFNALIQNARTSVVITNPYLVPDESLLGALITAAQRGVHVSILNSQAIDQWMVAHAQRSYYDELISAGVEIHLYKKPQLVHEKFMSIDDAVGVIGSSNLDIRSFELNLECVVVAYDQKTAITLHERHEELLKNSRKITLATWRKRSTWRSFLDSIARLTSALQ